MDTEYKITRDYGSSFLVKDGEKYVIKHSYGTIDSTKQQSTPPLTTEKLRRSIATSVIYFAKINNIMYPIRYDGTTYWLKVVDIESNTENYVEIKNGEYYEEHYVSIYKMPLQNTYSK